MDRHQGQGEYAALLVTVKGRVQGVGFRPFLFGLAEKYGVKGWVQNNMDGIRMEAEGPPQVLERFVHAIRSEAPRLSRVEEIACSPVPVRGYAFFEIAASSREGASSLVIPADSAVCSDCLEELLNPADRRYRYPFINCTQCGPRYTIIGELPYDRPYTSMKDFPMCGRCRSEYEDVRNRRHHAQPIACPECGPKVALYGMDGTVLADRDEAVRRCAELLKQGSIVGIKGLGGFHLACDAGNEEAVARLRSRKRRPRRPLAVMARDFAACGRICRVTPEERELLQSPEAPIVVMRRRAEEAADGETAAVLAGSVAPGMATVGVMLPYTPLHHLLMEELPYLVMTSANPSGLPILYKDEEAFSYLEGIADYMLGHNREILHPLDDSVVQVIKGRPDVLRRSRGYVPDPVPAAGTGAAAHGITAYGGQQKNTFALGRFRQIFLGPHIGDMDHVEVQAFWTREFEHLARWMGLPGGGLSAVDRHPDYAAVRMALEAGAELVRIQHHHAHLVSCAADNGLSMTEQVYGLILDGTGLGTDGAIWGFEALRGNAAGFQRLGHLRYTPLPGGEAAIRHPWRNAAAMLMGLEPEAGAGWAGRLFPGREQELVRIRLMAEKGVNSPLAGTCGRLFDAVSAMLGLCLESTYDGEAAILLSELASGEEAEASGIPAPYPYEVRLADGLWELDMRLALGSIAEDRLAGLPNGQIALRFHETVAQAAAELLIRGSGAAGGKAVLSGGSFHNRYLRRRVQDILERESFEVYTHVRVPSGDGGLSLGQLMAAAGGAGRAEGE